MNLINNNEKLIENLNIELHNHGIPFDNRIYIINSLIKETLQLNYNVEDIKNIDKELKKKLINILKCNILNYNELYHSLYMFYKNKQYQIDLDQYYTPSTIGSFITRLCINNKKIIDPACGVGDLLINYQGEIHLWDICDKVIKVCEDNYKLHSSIHNKFQLYNIKCLNSINNFDLENENFDYACLNPPFGVSTICNNSNLLQKYILGQNKHKEEIGILFIERLMNLLKENGIGFIIVPNGYLGNMSKNIIQLRKYILNFRIIGIIELPSNTFSRSGTGVSTSLLIIRKQKVKNHYNIFIQKINNIGYQLNKKNTPLKFKKLNGKYIFSNGKPILDNDLEDCYLKLSSFLLKENIHYLNFTKDSSIDYEFINTKDLYDNNLLDIKRYLNSYLTIVKNFQINNYPKLKNYIDVNANYTFQKINDNTYLYLDIKQIMTPIYSKTNILYGYELPQRAKYKLQKYDIIVSKLLGKLTFTIILNNENNIICTNGFIVLRGKNYQSTLILFGNLFQKEFSIQHNSLCTGSIMETINDKLFYDILINPNIDVNKYDNIIKTLDSLYQELYTFDNNSLYSL